MVKSTVNMYNSDFFEYRFKRKAKTWTLGMVQNLLDQLEERVSIRRKKLGEIANEIFEKIEPNDNGKYIVYYTHKNGSLCGYGLEKDKDFGGYSVSYGDYTPKTREDNLDFLIDSDLRFELGEKYKEMNELCSTRFISVVYRVFSRMIVAQIKSKFNNSRTVYLLKSTVVKIGDKKYIVKNDGYGNYHLDLDIMDYSELELDHTK